MVKLVNYFIFLLTYNDMSMYTVNRTTIQRTKEKIAEVVQMDFNLEFTPFSSSTKSGLFNAVKSGHYPYEKDEKPIGFDINTNVDYEKNIVSESIDIVCEHGGVATLFFKWQVDAIKYFFTSLGFASDCINDEQFDWYYLVSWNTKYKKPTKYLIDYLLATVIDLNIGKDVLSVAS
jgi:hypothetical protein